jgi:NADH dehydrogenase FAD-containing subunit
MSTDRPRHCRLPMSPNRSGLALRWRLLTFVLVGAEPTGVEMAGALAELAYVTLSRDFRNINPQTARGGTARFFSRVS